MSPKVGFLPLYDQYFSTGKEVDNSSSAKDWSTFQSKEEDFETPLSKHQIDFFVRDTTWFDRGTQIVSILVKTAIFSYLFYSWSGSTIQARIVQFLPRDKIAALVSKYMGKLPNHILIETAKRHGTVALRKLLSAWAFHATLRYIVQRLIMIPLYPIQSRIVKIFWGAVRTSTLNNDRKEIAYQLRIAYQLQQSRHNYIIRDVSLEKNGIRYSGLLIGHSKIINNGQWVLQATGNGEPIEHAVSNCALTYEQYGFNTLFINSPAVGKSEGEATPESMGEAQEVGLRFIEEALKARKVVIAGRSLGGAAIGQAILQHEFKEKVKYLVVRQMTFGRASDICGKVVGKIFSPLERFVASLVRWAGCEMDSVAASQKLEKLGIKEVIVQASCKEILGSESPTIDDFHDDGVIHAHASLAHTLIHESVTDKKVFRCLKFASHMTHDAVEAAEQDIRDL